MDQDKYIGRLLDNRYEIQEVLGVGGMAVVYKARCHRLNRLVAIKILKDEHAQDEEFRRRFHAESQAVAMLSHPNIVSVYDVASTGDANYIVMELIDGITLKQYMEKKGILNWKETLHFAIQIGKALEHAHSRGIVHRDIKPHNVMVLKNGSVKVTDFGIARVMSKSNTLTKEALGSVHYISPEQAKGGRVDSRSDIYSLGVVMYEMITGRPPYDGESPVAVAIQHINGGAKMPSVLNPNIPGGLEQIIMKAMAHDPAGRYDNATAMLYDMDEFRKDPTMLFYYNAAALDDVTKLTPPAVAVGGTQTQEQPRKTTAERVVSRNDHSTGTRAAAAGTAISRRTDRTARSGASQNRQTTSRRRREEAEQEEDRSRVVTIAIISCSVVAIVAIMIFLWTFLNGGWFSTPDDELLEVPNLLGKVYEDLDKDDYRDFEIVLLDRQYSDEYEAGEIMSQEPTAGGDKKVKGTKIVVIVSRGQEPKTLVMDQDLVGTAWENAKNWLVGHGVPEHLILVKNENSAEIEAGNVTRTDPAYGEEIADGQTVTIWYSLGKEIVNARMPNVVGMLYEDALKKLNDEGFMDVTPEEVDSMEPAGTVLEQSATRYIEYDVTTPIVLQVSKGPETKEMLNVMGKTYDEAYAELTKAGFVDVYPEEVESNEPAGTVVGQSVAPTMEIAVNAPIALEVSKGPKEVTIPDLVDKTYEDACAELIALGIPEHLILVKDEHSVDVEEGKVTRTEPAYGETITVDQNITIWCSLGKEIVNARMPNVVGMTYEDALKKLNDEGFMDVTPEEVDSMEPAGQVLEQSATRYIEYDVTTPIVLQVSKGPASPEILKETVIFDLSTVLNKLELTEAFDFAVGKSLSEADHRMTYNADVTTIEITLLGYDVQHYDIFINGIYVDDVRVVFSDENTTTEHTVELQE